MNKREEGDFGMERLERAFASVEWINTYPSFAIRNLLILHLDHGPIILDLEFQHPFRHTLFLPLLKNVVQRAQDTHSAGSRAFHFKNKISRVWTYLITWNKEIFGKVEREIHQKQLQLQDIQNSILTIDDVRKERIIREDLELMMHQEELMWAQKARSNWIVLGDKNTKNFPTRVKQRRARNRILQLKTADGNVIENPMEIETTLVNHFKQFIMVLSLVTLISFLKKSFLFLSLNSLFNNLLYLIDLSLMKKLIVLSFSQVHIKFLVLTASLPFSTKNIGALLGLISSTQCMLSFIQVLSLKPLTIPTLLLSLKSPFLMMLPIFGL